MRKLTIILFFAELIFAACESQSDRLQSLPISVDTSGIFSKEIPTYEDGRHKGDTDYIFKDIRRMASELRLDSIENGFDSLQIRIWLGHSMAIRKNIVILKKINGKWSAQLVTYSEGQKGKTLQLFIEKKTIKSVHPLSGWDVIIKKINALEILTLPNDGDLKDYNGCGMDGIAYYFETSTKRQYRFFYYCNPEDNVGRFREAKNVLEFASVLENEFDFTYTK